MQVVVGRIGRPHGVRGEVVVDVRTDEPDKRFAPGAVLSTEAGPLEVESARWHGSRMLVRFRGYADRTAVEELRGALLRADVPEDERPPDPDEFYDHQLVGLRARTVDGRDVGEVTEVVHLPMQELLVVRADAGREIFVPFVRSIVPDVDLDAGVIVLDPPEGLLEP
ncbi:MAG TPA: ribosome maturation factor RimM [Actinopolymorphaceae bacterium]|jgi:16S rRNA processing protein RimM